MQKISSLSVGDVFEYSFLNGSVTILLVRFHDKNGKLQVAKADLPEIQYTIDDTMVKKVGSIL